MDEHLRALMEGLEIPNPEWWLDRHPDLLRLLGKSIADQAKQVKAITEGAKQ